jgi:hypothetical protein
MLPDDPESTILKRLKKPTPDDQNAPDAGPDRRSEQAAPTIQARNSGTQ